LKLKELINQIILQEMKNLKEASGKVIKYSGSKRHDSLIKELEKYTNSAVEHVDGDEDFVEFHDQNWNFLGKFDMKKSEFIIPSK